MTDLDCNELSAYAIPVYLFKFNNNLDPRETYIFSVIFLFPLLPFTRSHGLPALSHVWQHVKLLDTLSWGPFTI